MREMAKPSLKASGWFWQKQIAGKRLCLSPVRGQPLSTFGKWLTKMGPQYHRGAVCGFQLGQQTSRSVAYGIRVCIHTGALCVVACAPGVLALSQSRRVCPRSNAKRFRCLCKGLVFRNPLKGSGYTCAGCPIFWNHFNAIDTDTGAGVWFDVVFSKRLYQVVMWSVG